MTDEELEHMEDAVMDAMMWLVSPFFYTACNSTSTKKGMSLFAIGVILFFPIMCITLFPIMVCLIVEACISMMEIIRENKGGE